MSALIAEPFTPDQQTRQTRNETPQHEPRPALPSARIRGGLLYTHFPRRTPLPAPVLVVSPAIDAATEETTNDACETTNATRRPGSRCTPSPLRVAGRIGSAPLQAVEPLEKRSPIPSLTIDGVHITASVTAVMGDHGYTPQMLVEAARSPEQRWPDRLGTAEVRLRGPVAVLVAHDNGDIIAIASRDRALQERTYTRPGSVPKARGTGARKPTPTDTPALLARLREHGFDYHLDGGDHWRLSHPSAPQVHLSIAQTPSDHRTIPNEISKIRRKFGIDVRDEPCRA